MFIENIDKYLSKGKDVEFKENTMKLFREKGLNTIATVVELLSQKRDVLDNPDIRLLLSYYTYYIL